jgi:ferrous iron transport protein B
MKRIALLGMPNTGKSTFFNRITGANARIGNWPGITVDLFSAKLMLGAEMVEIVDLPGIYEFPGYSEDEQVVKRFLENTPVDMLVVILNTTQIEQQLHLLMQIRHFNMPMLVLLNMADEARHYGIKVDTGKLSESLASPVILLSAKYGDGYENAHAALTWALNQASAPRESIPAAQLQLDPAKDDALRVETENLFKQCVTIPHQLPRGITQRVDQLFLHPWLGIPLFFFIMYLVFQGVFWLGAPLQDAVAWLLDTFRSGVLEPWLTSSPVLLQGLLLDGVYDGVGTVASFVPIIILFFMFMTFIEDSGYLSRAAFLMDAFMAKMGLDGRSFVMLLMGLGCNVPALMGSRVMRTRGLRWLTMLITPFSLCTARLQVFVFLIAALFLPQHAGLALFSLYIMSFAAAFITALIFRKPLNSHEPFVLEVPPYRLPTLWQVVLRSWHEVRHFLVRASQFIISGVVMVWLLTNFPQGVPSEQTWAGQLSALLYPIFAPLGIEHNLIIALIFGFVAKEVVIGALVVIYGGLEGAALQSVLAQSIDWVQAYSFMLFILLYTPCVSTIAVLHSESRSWRFTTLTLVWGIALAWTVSFIFYQTMRWLGF